MKGVFIKTNASLSACSGTEQDIFLNGNLCLIATANIKLRLVLSTR